MLRFCTSFFSVRCTEVGARAPARAGAEAEVARAGEVGVRVIEDEAAGFVDGRPVEAATAAAEGVTNLTAPARSPATTTMTATPPAVSANMITQEIEVV